MKTVAIAVMLAGLSGCSVMPGTTVYEASLGANVTKQMPWSKGMDGGFRGGTDVVQFSVRQESTRGMFVEFRHSSHLSSGWPVNTNPEDWSDVVSVGYRFQVRQ